MVGEASATKINEAMTAKADEAEAVKAVEGAALIDTGKMVAEAASTSLRTED
jgi:alcohol dehydrogenase YqhD (iron-dependent ADH family)